MSGLLSSLTSSITLMHRHSFFSQGSRSKGMRGKILHFVPQSAVVQANVRYEHHGTPLITSCIPIPPDSPQAHKELKPRPPLTDWPHNACDLVEGVVVSMKPYGVFIKVDDVVGLLHISEV